MPISRGAQATADSIKSGGSVPVRLDELAACQDNSANDATASYHGLMPKLSGSQAQFMRGDGQWAAPTGGGGTAKESHVVLVAAASGVAI